MRNPDDNGKWMASTDEEHWNDSERFETREDALRYAVETLAPDNGLEDGDHFWTGQIRAVDLDELAAAGVSGLGVIESMECWIGDNVGIEEPSIDVPKGAEDDLEARLAAAVRAWMTAHGIEVDCYHIDAVKSEVWRQCTARAVGGDLDGHRCCLHNGHGLLDGTAGDHEWH